MLKKKKATAERSVGPEHSDQERRGVVSHTGNTGQQVVPVLSRASALACIHEVESY